MSAITDLIAAAHEQNKWADGNRWRELADAAEKELAALQQSHDAHAEGVEHCAANHAEPRIDVEALRKALSAIYREPWMDEHGIAAYPRDAHDYLSSLLAQFDGARRAESEAWVQAGEPVSGMLIGEAAHPDPCDNEDCQRSPSECDYYNGTGKVGEKP